MYRLSVILNAMNKMQSRKAIKLQCAARHQTGTVLSAKYVCTICEMADNPQ